MVLICSIAISEIESLRKTPYVPVFLCVNNFNDHILGPDRAHTKFSTHHGHGTHCSTHYTAVLTLQLQYRVLQYSLVYTAVVRVDLSTLSVDLLCRSGSAASSTTHWLTRTHYTSPHTCLACRCSMISWVNSRRPHTVTRWAQCRPWPCISHFLFHANVSLRPFGRRLIVAPSSVCFRPSGRSWCRIGALPTTPCYSLLPLKIPDLSESGEIADLLESK